MVSTNLLQCLLNLWDRVRWIDLELRLMTLKMNYQSRKININESSRRELTQATQNLKDSDPT